MAVITSLVLGQYGATGLGGMTAAWVWASVNKLVSERIVIIVLNRASASAAFRGKVLSDWFSY